jgi:prephenate dehydrogenase
MTRVGIVGYGRFGEAFASLCRERGFPVSVHDPQRRPPPELEAPGLAELAGRAEVVVLATPVPAFVQVLRGLRPFLEAGHRVLDVGSVKVRPMEVMEAELGAEVPWVGSHPLFGPVSLAQAERPLRVVLCAHPGHPSALEAARRLYEGLGCEVLEQDPHAHDRAMAKTHALAFFLAKGLLDAGAGEGVEAPPPSFRALARSIELVRGDAGHLFRVLQTENPYAAQERHRLLGALQSVDRALEEEARGPGRPGGPDLEIASPSGPTEDLQDTRELIDAVDRELLSLLERRARLALRAARAKAALGQGIQDPDREARLLAARRRWAEDRGLRPEAVESMFQLILEQSRALQASGPT